MDLGIANNIVGTFGNTIIWILIGLFAFGFIGALIFIIDIYRKYNIKTIVISQRSNMKGGIDNKILIKKGGFIFNKKKGIWVFKIIWNPWKFDFKEIKPIDFSHVQMNNMVFIRQKSPEEFYPINTSIVEDQTNLSFKTIESDDKFWAAQSIGAYYELSKNQSWIEKYLPYIIFSVLAIMIIILIYVVLQKFEVLVAVADKLDMVARNLNSANCGTQTV